MAQPTITTLATFATDGTHPYGVLVADAAGNLYGTTYNGGTNNQGTIFELAAGSSTITTLVSFNGINGNSPVAGLTIDAAGNLFGATAYGGPAQDGTLFELAKGATAVTTLATFSDTDGAVPQSVLTEDAAGNLFGTTNGNGGSSLGTLFELKAGDSAVTTLATFNGANGAFGEGGVVIDDAGNIFGTTVYGGVGPGTIFELANGATELTTAAAFHGPDGAAARSGLIADAAGNFYGTTYSGGSANLGTVYELVKGANAVTTLASFTGDNGSNPYGNLALDAAGNLYGTANLGGAAGDGTVFKLIKGASFITTLGTFTAATGGNPYAGLTIDAAGNLFGTTTSGNGTVFELAAGTVASPLNVVATSPDTVALLAAVNQAIGDLPPADVYLDNGGAIPPAPAPGSALLLPAGRSGPIAVPSGYGLVELESGSNVNLTGGDATTKIIGDGFTYNGVAAWVGSGAGVSQITDDAAGATILIGSSGSATVTAGGANATVVVGDAGTAAVTLSGAGASINTGSNSNVTLLASGNAARIVVGNGATAVVAITGTGDTVEVGGSLAAQAGAAPTGAFTSEIQDTVGSGTVYNIHDANSVNLIALGNSDTVNATAGVSTIFALGADSISTGLGHVFVVGGNDVSTIQGGAADAVVFATSGQVFDVGSAQNNTFVGGTSASTINANAGGGGFFGGTHGDVYNFGTGAAQTFVGLGGADTLSGAAGTVAPVVFALNAEHMMFTAATQPVTVVSYVSGGVIDTSLTGGNNTFFAGYGVAGNETLIGSTALTDSSGAATHDVFVAGANPSGGATAMTIDNWHAGDVFYLTGFNPSDVATMDNAISSNLGQGAVGDLSFTLSDNTTITFAANHPTNFSGNAAF